MSSIDVRTALLMDRLRVRAKANASDECTGWHTIGDVACAYYPVSKRYAYFTTEVSSSFEATKKIREWVIKVKAL
jgi:hypothetical protein